VVGDSNYFRIVGTQHFGCEWVEGEIDSFKQTIVDSEWIKVPFKRK
jgi:hypothetical protein